MRETLHQEHFNAKQLRLPLSMDILIPFDSEVRTFDTLYRQIDVRKHLVSGKEKGRLRYDPTKMLALILFCQMEKIHSLRDMAKAARNDIRIMWLTDELKPSHQAIKRFMDDVLSCRIDEIFHEMMTLIVKKENVNTDILYIDGTKIEANANKYRFVWKKAVEKHKARLDRKIDTVMARLGERYASERLLFPILETYDSSLLNKVTIFLEREMKAQDVTPVHGKGTRKTALQRDYDEMLAYTKKMVEYEHALSVMGPDRNSYAKTDTDATYMRMKDDHMRNGQLKAGYNVQIGVSDEHIMHVDVFQKRTDYMTMIPFLEGYKKTYGVYPAWPVADAGYGGLLNYRFIKNNGMELCQKYGMYHKDTHDTKHILNPYRAENFKKDKKGNYLCPKGRKMVYLYTKKSGQKVYKSSSCLRCPLAKECRKGKRNRQIEINEELWGYQKDAREILGSELGIELRIQRSIQVEGAFGVLKEDFGFRRFRRRGITNVKFEVMLIAIGYNLAKFHHRQERIIS